MFGIHAEEAVPSAIDLQYLRHFKLAPAASEHRRFQRPRHQVGRGSKSDASCIIDFVDPSRARCEEHQPPRADRILHDPGVAHGTIVPCALPVGLVMHGVRACQIETEAISHPLPGLQIFADGVTDPLDQRAFRFGGAGKKIVPRAIVATQRRPSPDGLVVPSRTFGRRKRGSVMLPRYEIVADGMALGHVPVAKIRIADRFRSLQVPAMPVVAVVQVPAVPDPMIFKCQHAYPFTPVDAIEAMNARCRTR